MVDLQSWKPAELEPLTLEEADEIVGELTDGQWHVKWAGSGILLCRVGRLNGVFLLPKQMTRLGIVLAVVENYPLENDG